MTEMSSLWWTASIVSAVPLLATVAALSACSDSRGGLLEHLMRSRAELFESVLENVDEHGIQILYTQIDRDESNRPRLTEHRYRVDASEYFYPASTVKLAGALAALEKLNRLGVEGLGRNTPLRIDSAYSGQSPALTDTTSQNGLPSIGHYIKKVFLVSDNDAYNRLYEFVGQRALNESLWEKGYSNVRLTHRLSVSLTPDENRHTNPFTFLEGDRVIYRQAAASNPDDFAPGAPILKGIAHYRGDSLIQEPMNFSRKNYMSLETLHELLKAVVLPESVAERRRFDLTEDDYTFLYRVMGMLPGESRFPRYDSEQYWDSRVKFFLFGDSKEPMPEGIRIFNKVGDAYGYLIDNAYVVDFEHGIEFLLTAVISVNRNRTYNDDEYEYDETGLPFLANLGRTVYEYELQRQRSSRPDLSRFDVAFAD